MSCHSTKPADTYCKLNVTSYGITNVAGHKWVFFKSNQSLKRVKMIVYLLLSVELYMAFDISEFNTLVAP